MPETPDAAGNAASTLRDLAVSWARHPPSRPALTAFIHRIALSLSLVAVAGLPGCAADTSMIGYCAAPRSIAIAVSVTDSVTGRYLADSASGFVQSGSVVAPLVLATGVDSLMYGGDSLGSYGVTVNHAGYAPWVRAGIQVTVRGPCGNVEPVHVHALLQAAP